MTAELDHLVVAAASLDAGADFVERLLGARPGGGGRHEGAGTHNRLLGLGPNAYLEVLAPDPEAGEPAQPRLFGLDRVEVRQRMADGPFLLTWVARTPALDEVVGRVASGPVRRMSRGGLAWRLAECPTRADFAGIVPSLIEWDGPGAAGHLPDSGCRIEGLDARHPEVDALRGALEARGLGDVMTIAEGAQPTWQARISRADGRAIRLSSE